MYTILPITMYAQHNTHIHTQLHIHTYAHRYFYSNFTGELQVFTKLNEIKYCIIPCCYVNVQELEEQPYMCY